MYTQYTAFGTKTKCDQSYRLALAFPTIVKFSKPVLPVILFGDLEDTGRRKKEKEKKKKGTIAAVMNNIPRLQTPTNIYLLHYTHTLLYRLELGGFVPVLHHNLTWVWGKFGTIKERVCILRLFSFSFSCLCISFPCNSFSHSV